MRLRLVSCVRLSLLGLASLTLAPACLNWGALENGACGDGFVGREEACDDGNRISGDGCSEACQIEPAVCGDGRVDTDKELCDDGNNSNTDDCIEDCQLATCGDGFVQEFVEQCDDGNQNDGDGCSQHCMVEMTAAAPTCGDGTLDANEACDDGNQSETDSCLSGCSWATCGDGRVRTGVEECDPGAPNALGECTKGCSLCEDSSTKFFRPGTAHCYSVHTEAVTEQQARAACQAEGGDLWTVTSQVEGSDVISKLSLEGRYWLGFLTGKVASGWVTGENTKYTSFAPGEPSDLALRCVVLDPSSGWSSEDCAAQQSYVCERSPAFVFPIDHHAYLLHTGALTADAARARCAADGGHLAALETDLERQFVGKNVGVAAWLDASDSASENQFVWPNGDPVDPMAFAQGQPDGSNASQGCLMLNPGDRFADAACSEPHPFICEFD